MQVLFDGHEELLHDLCSHEKSGAELEINNCPATPLDIVYAHSSVQEGSGYMRDYIFDEEGRLKKLCFHQINEE